MLVVKQKLQLCFFYSVISDCLNMAFNISSSWKYLFCVCCWNIFQDMCQFFPVVLCLWVIGLFLHKHVKIADLQNTCGCVTFEQL